MGKMRRAGEKEMDSKQKKGKFIVLEGLDGSGKGTQVSRLAEALRQQGRKVCQTAEPTISVTGGLLRDALGGFVKRDAYELSALFLLDRIFHNVNEHNGIQQYLEKGYDVVCDRYYYSSFAYQGIDADLQWVMDMNLSCREILKPDVCIFLDVSPDVGEQRLAESRTEREIYENSQTQKKVRERFLEVFRMLEGRENIRIVDASRSVGEVSADIIEIYNSLKEK